MSGTNKLSPCEDLRIGGIEGGGTHSTLIIVNGKGDQLVQISGLGTNHWSLGMNETAKRINEMIVSAKKKIGMPETSPLDCTGLYLSGCEEDETNRELIDTLMREFPSSSKEYIVGSDTMGSLSTGASNGGVVLIAGTGSNALLENPDGITHSCGGWGHMMGDEGSAYWIAHRACKYVFDDIDGLIPSPKPTDYVWPAMKDFFQVADRSSMLPYFYSNFAKSKIALFTEKLAIGCASGDPFCGHVFEESGRYLAKHLNAVARKAHDSIKLRPGGLRVVCVGSVWKSWDYLKTGFLREIDEGRIVDELTLMKLTVSAALGACYRAGDKMGCDGLNKCYEKNSNVFFHYKRNDNQPSGGE